MQLVDVTFTQIKLTQQLTPALRYLWLQNVLHDCDLTALLPELSTVSIHCLDGQDAAINAMLACAVNLDSFDSYKLGLNEMHFASNELYDIDLYRSDYLEKPHHTGCG